MIMGKDIWAGIYGYGYTGKDMDEDIGISIMSRDIWARI